MFIDRFSNFIGNIIAWLVPIAVIFTTYEIVMRYIFDSPTTWVHVLTTALMASLFVLSGANSLQRGELIRMSLLVDRTSGRLRGLLNSFSTGLTVIWGSVLVWSGGHLAYTSVVRFRGGEWKPETTGGAWDVPIPAIVKTVLAIAFLLFILQAAAIFIRSFRKGNRK